MGTQKNHNLQDFIHPKLDQEITAIGGHYILTKETCLPFQGRKLLYLVGYAVFDTTCCGAGGCSYALVPGFILDWKSRNNADGIEVSKMEPIRDESLQDQIRRLILSKEQVQQVNFI